MGNPMGVGMDGDVGRAAYGWTATADGRCEMTTWSRVQPQPDGFDHSKTSSNTEGGERGV